MTTLSAARATKIVTLKCTQCGGPMRLFGIEPHPTLGATELRSYVCVECEDVQTEQVALQAS